MKQIKLILTSLILAISLAGIAPTAIAQKEPIKTCPKCGKAYKGSHVCPKAEKTCSQCKKSKSSSSFQKNSSICSDCVAKNKEAERIEAERIINDYVNSMVYVAGGTFTMGATREQGDDVDIDEKPTHSVSLSSYYIGKTEVTQELWKAVMGTNPSFFKGAKRPVENVSWDDCQKFIRKLNAKTGKNFRLPTEAEWEYAARGGNKSKGYKYSGSNTIDDVAWYGKNCYDKGSSHPDYGTHPVATKRANELGIYDMSGNVCEWCQNKWYNYDGSLADDSFCVTHGGCWGDPAWFCRVSKRYPVAPSYRIESLGFRLAL